MLPVALVWLPLLSQAVPESGIGARQWTRNAMLPPVLFSGVTRAQGSRVSAIVRELGWELTVLHRVRLPSGGLLGHGGARHQ